MAVVKEATAPALLKRPNVETASTVRLNVMSHLLAAQKALDGTTVLSGGILRDLISSNPAVGMSLGGHRGMGENLLNDHEPLNLPSLWRENSIKSFLKARQHGARFVEMDVQVTADGVPVIWHDDDMTFGPQMNPISTCIRDLYYEEFKALGPQKLQQNEQIRELIPLHRRFRFSSNPASPPLSAHYTAWRCFDEDVLPSLLDVLETLPVDLGLNLEVKMSTASSLAQTPATELHRMLNPIVALLKAEAKTRPERHIVLSSFDPDICTLAKAELQKEGLEATSVMFLTTGGASPHADPRRMSLERAVDFCLEEGLDGMVADTSQLRTEPYLVQRAVQQGLGVMTYGLENNDVQWLLDQWHLGVHGAIVDDVAQVVPEFCQRVQEALAAAAVNN